MCKEGGGWGEQQRKQRAAFFFFFLSLLNKSLIMAGASGLRECVFSARGS